MPDPSWPSSPPELNYIRLVGPGATGTATTLASGATWQAVMAGDEMAYSSSALNSGLTAPNFEGVGGLSSTATVSGLNSALQLLAGWVQEKPPIAASAVSAYETAVSAMIPAEISLANRAAQAADVAINPSVFGALTPAIVALDMEYFGEHWPYNASIGAAYGATLSALAAALAVPPPISPPGANPAAPAAAASALAQAAAGEALKDSAQSAQVAGDGTAQPAETGSAVGQIASSLVQPLRAATGMFPAPMQSLSGLSDVPNALGGAFGMGTTEEFTSVAPLAAPVLTSPGGVTAGGFATGPVSGGGVVAGSGLSGLPTTSYVRPSNSFEPENRARPVALKTGLLSTEFHGPTTSGTNPGGVLPVSPAGIPGKNSTDKPAVTHARVVIGNSQSRGRNNSQ